MANGAGGGTYVEPYAGGAGIALALLLSEQVERVVINDLDPALYSFWAAATQTPSDFQALVREAPLTIDEWQRQREIYRAGDVGDVLELGFAAFYLNRTNRSGVLTGGVIGGQSQSGNYKIDARFNRETLLDRCRLLGLYAGRIEVSQRDGRAVIEDFVAERRTFVYADPPYFEKGSQLYLNSFAAADHKSLADTLNARSTGTWMLTYDVNDTIVDLYSERRSFRLDINYSVREARASQELLIVSDTLEADFEAHNRVSAA
jgi:DNA adenine methylase